VANMESRFASKRPRATISSLKLRLIQQQ